MSITGFTDIGKGRKALSVDHDPTSVATDAPMGSLLIDANGKVYRKTDDGETTNVICVGLCKSDHAATVAPTVNNDSGAGYSVGSHWYDVTADKAYVCLDATVAAAVWKEITPTGESYVDRGDPAAVDLSQAAMTMDNIWYDWDLSAIVGAAARLVHLRAVLFDAGGRTLSLRTNGNVNAKNISQLDGVAGEMGTADLWVKTDAAGKVEYRVTNVATSIQLTVAGWMESA